MRLPCCAAPVPAAPGLGRPRGPRRADTDPAPEPADAPTGHPGYCAALAPPPGRPEVDLPAPDGPAAGQPGDRRADRAARPRESRLGIPAEPGRPTQPPPAGPRLHGPPRSRGPGHTAPATT